MPQTKNKPTWVQHYREQLRETIPKEAGWYVGNSRGKIRIEIKVGIYQSKTLQFDWSKAGFAIAADEIKQIYKRFYEGETKTLAEAFKE